MFSNTQPQVYTWTSMGRQPTATEELALKLQAVCGTRTAADFLRRVGYPFVLARYLLCEMRKGSVLPP